MDRFIFAMLLSGCLATPSFESQNSSQNGAQNDAQNDLKNSDDVGLDTHNKDVQIEDATEVGHDINEARLEVTGSMEVFGRATVELIGDDGEIESAGVTGDHMVLQEGRSIEISWGTPGRYEIEFTTTNGTYTEPVTVSFRISQITVGNTHGCLLSNGRVMCWGNNDRGELGAAAPDDLPRLVETFGEVTEIYGGFSQNCAKLTDGRGVCWGANLFQSLVTSGDIVVPPSIYSEDVFSISLGEQFSCRIDEQQTVSCRGSDAEGQVNPVGTAQGGFNSLALMISPTKISSTNTHTCAIEAGSPIVSCWGDNSLGALQAGDLVSINESQPFEDLIDVAVVTHGSCALGENGSVCCWGKEPSFSTGVSCSVPWVSTDGTPYSTIKGSRSTVCAQNETGVDCWQPDIGAIGETIFQGVTPIANGAAMDVWDIGDSNFCWVDSSGPTVDEIKCVGRATGVIDSETFSTAPVTIAFGWDANF